MPCRKVMVKDIVGGSKKHTKAVVRRTIRRFM